MIAQPFTFLLKHQRPILNGCLAFVVVCIIFIAHVQIGERKRDLSVFSGPNNLSHFYSPLNSSERKLVLLWTPFFSEKNWLPSTKQLNCLVQECDVTSNRALVTESSAIILHLRDLNTEDLPPECSVSSKENNTETCPRLVLFNRESPPHTNPETLRRLHQKIHLLATYRRDSEIYAPYGVITNRKAKNKFNIPDLSKKRTTVCWLVSNCHTSSSREIYTNNLKSYIDVEVYGNCGNKSCPHKEALDCYQMLSEHCKFYLSFENSICRDYATEKLYYALMTDMVPIVMGGDDYARYLPPHSFINVEDFSSPKALAEYLLELNNDDFRYLRYFRWKTSYESVITSYTWFCDLCYVLHSDKMEHVTTHGDLMSWWFEGSYCGSLK